MKDFKKMEPLIKAAERIKTDQTLPRELARKLLAINRGFQREARKYFQALEILKDSKKLLGKVNSGKMTKEAYKTKMRRASRRVKQTESFAQALSNMARSI